MQSSGSTIAVLKCVKCSGNHQTANCTIDCNANNHEHLRCGNCDQQHTASFNQCPSSLEYIGMRHRQSSKSSGQRYQPTGTIHDAQHTRAAQPPPLNRSHFPSLPSTPNRSSHQTNGTSNQHTYNASHSPPTWAQMPPHPEASKDNETLFSTKELFNIFQQLTNKLKSCRSRIDQINVITEVAINHCLMP